jgi:hypothetical protein
MTKSVKSGEVVRYISRTGEGTAVDAAVRPVTTASGRSAGLMTVNISSAPVPERRYVAEVCSVTYEKETVKLWFGQPKHNSNKLRTLLVIHMSPSSVRHFIDSIRAVKNPTYEELAQDNHFQKEPLSTLEDEPDQTVAFAANFILAGMSGREACLDFFHASAFAISAVVHTSKLALDAVVRVDLRSSLALGLFQELGRLVAEAFPPDLAFKV